jgi:poly(A) polymerase
MSDAAPVSAKLPSLRSDASAVVQRLRDAGHVAYFAGGCVRDELLGLQPKDYDVATDAPPPRVRELFSNTLAVGAKFGVILVRQGKSQVEVATFRREGIYEDGRRPAEVHFTGAEEDARRRDFTINGLFFDPSQNKLIDFVGGRADLENRILRAIGRPQERFEEDHLRLLRAIRFAARFELTIEPATAAAIRVAAPQLKRISPERIAEELRLISAHPSNAKAWRAMCIEFPGLAQAIFRFAGQMPENPARWPGVLEAAKTDGAPFGVWLSVIALEWSIMHGGADLRQILSPENVRRTVQVLRQSLRISNDESSDARSTLEGLAILLADPPLPVATVRRFLARPTACWSRAILRALSSHVDARVIQTVERQLEEYSRLGPTPLPLVTGDDLVARGIRPGPLFKRVLNEVYDAQLESRVTSREAALELAMRLANDS